MQIAFVTERQYEPLVDLLCDQSIHYNGVNAAERSELRSYLLHTLLAPEASVRIAVASSKASAALGYIAITLFHSFVNPDPAQRGQLFIRELYVGSAHRGLGVGRALMQWAARHAMETGCVRMDWHVTSSNQAALDFYASLGGNLVVDRWSFRLDDEGLTRLANAAGAEGKT